MNPYHKAMLGIRSLLIRLITTMDDDTCENVLSCIKDIEKQLKRELEEKKKIKQSIYL
jgi:hypothetical protein